MNKITLSTLYIFTKVSLGDNQNAKDIFTHNDIFSVNLCFC